jgi:hypothetical protein
MLDGFIAGYVDGEGSFSISIQRNPSCRIGLQLVPEFHVSQNGDRAQVLQLIRGRRGCGYVKPNSKRDRALVFVVRDSCGRWPADATCRRLGSASSSRLRSR